jgi:adenylate cyclase
LASAAGNSLRIGAGGGDGSSAAGSAERALRKPPGSLDAWAAYQRGLWHFSKFTAEDNAVAQRFFQQGIDLDPTFSGGYWGLAAAHYHASYVFRWTVRSKV